MLDTDLLSWSWPWPLTLISPFDLDIELSRKTSKCDVKTRFITVWPLTYDLDLQSQANQSQGQPSCKKSRSKVKRFKQESTNRQTNGQTDATKRIISPASRSIMSNDTWISLVAIDLFLRLQVYYQHIVAAHHNIHLMYPLQPFYIYIHGLLMSCVGVFYKLGAQP